MSAALHLAGPDDLERLSALVATHHGDSDLPPATRDQALKDLLGGNVQGAAYLIGMRRAPVGYVVVSFGFSVRHGGQDATIDDLFIREKLRGRGMGSEVLISLAKALANGGIKAIHLRGWRNDPQSHARLARIGFRASDDGPILTRTL